jgi:hypothetical protein
VEDPEPCEIPREIPLSREVLSCRNWLSRQQVELPDVIKALPGVEVSLITGVDISLIMTAAEVGMGGEMSRFFGGFFGGRRLGGPPPVPSPLTPS